MDDSVSNKESAMPISTPTPTEESIRAIAYGLWLEEGRPDGRAEAHWLKAYQLACGESKPAPVTAKNAAAPKKTTRRKAS